MEKINKTAFIEFDFDGNLKSGLNFITDVDNSRNIIVKLNEKIDDVEMEMYVKQLIETYKVKGVKNGNGLFKFDLPNLKSGVAKIQFLVYKGDNVLGSNISEFVVKKSILGDTESENKESIALILKKIIENNNDEKTIKKEIENLKEEVNELKSSKIDTNQFALKKELENITTKKGEKGENGKSAYELAVENGYVGSINEWLISLKGENGSIGQQGIQGIKGDTGENGANGVGIEKIELLNTVDLNNKFRVTYTDKNIFDFTIKNGKNGLNGLSAYEIWLNQGNAGTEETFLTSLRGEGVDTEEINSLKQEIEELKNQLKTSAGLFKEFESDRINLVNSDNSINSPRIKLHTGEGNNRIFRVYFRKAFSEVPVLNVTLNTNSDFLTTAAIYVNGGNKEYFLVRINYISHLAYISYTAHVPN